MLPPQLYLSSWRWPELKGRKLETQPNMTLIRVFFLSFYVNIICGNNGFFPLSYFNVPFFIFNGIYNYHVHIIWIILHFVLYPISTYISHISAFGLPCGVLNKYLFDESFSILVWSLDCTSRFGIVSPELTCMSKWVHCLYTCFYLCALGSFWTLVLI